MEERAVIPASRITRTSWRELPTPKGKTVAPVVSRLAWSVKPPIQSW